MTRDEFKKILADNGYSPYIATEEDREFESDWHNQRDGWLYKKFGITEVAFQVEDDDSINVWCSIVCIDTGLEWDVRDLTLLNMFLVAFNAEPLKNISHIARIEGRYEV